MMAVHTRQEQRVQGGVNHVWISIGARKQGAHAPVPVPGVLVLSGGQQARADPALDLRVAIVVIGRQVLLQPLDTARHLAVNLTTRNETRSRDTQSPRVKRLHSCVTRWKPTCERSAHGFECAQETTTPTWCAQERKEVNGWRKAPPPRKHVPDARAPRRRAPSGTCSSQS